MKLAPTTKIRIRKHQRERWIFPGSKENFESKNKLLNLYSHALSFGSINVGIQLMPLIWGFNS
jgi:hypothetical protein